MLLSAPSTREGACESLMVFTVLAIALQVPKSRSCQLQVFDFALTRHLELCWLNARLTEP